MEPLDGEDGDLEDLQWELQMIADSEEEIVLIIETTVDPDTEANDTSKAVAENLLETVWKIMHESVSQNHDMIFLNKLALFLR